MRVIGNAQDAFRLSQTHISLGGGRTVRLSDIADVRDLYAEQRSLAMMNGRQVVSFGVERARAPRTSPSSTRRGRRSSKLERENPEGPLRRALLHSVDYTKAQYKSAMEALIEGAILAVLVVFLFLRDFRATLISALAIPLSAIPTFWFMGLLGFTLNGMSLLALSLVAGVLVDDAIVEIENIVRHMRMGKSGLSGVDRRRRRDRSRRRRDDLLDRRRVPAGRLMPGIAGQFFKQFGFTVVVAVLISLRSRA